jgi:mono/diheme cytochrome c family protein
MKTFTSLIALAALGVAAGAGFVYSGAYNMAADEPHWPVTFKLIETLRERSIGAHAKGIEVPKLDEPKLIAEGAEHYAAMCSGCHLAPGMEDTEIRAGLYPQPPNLSAHAHGESHADMDMSAMAARQFWIIKHGIKMTAMPAWGTSHDDKAIWGLVAFLQKLPEMKPEEYKALTDGEGGGHDHGAHPHGAASSGDGHAGESHGEKPAAESAPAGHVDAPGAPPHSHGSSKEADGAEGGHDHAH